MYICNLPQVGRFMVKILRAYISKMGLFKVTLGEVCQKGTDLTAPKRMVQNFYCAVQGGCP
jgi:hypothetical protein